VKFVQLTPAGPRQLLISDMRHGVVVLWTPARPDEPARVIARIPHPSHTTVVDLDGDGILDILVANLGIFWPEDTREGSVVWLRGQANGEFQSTTLIEGISRVNDVQAADFDGDGDLDLIVAVFGNFTTGNILYLENVTEDWSQPDFEPRVLDGRTGTTDVPLVDLNGDGHPDFISLQAQEHELVTAWLGDGKGRFQSQKLFAAPHPRWGSTGLKLADLDGDGDIDILLSNGDSVQVPPVLRPYHGVSWLENKGDGRFAYHRLAHLPGAHTSQPADLDGDGVLDVATSVFIPAITPSWPNADRLETIAWIRQTEPGRFQRYVIETGVPYHPCLDAADYDGDGDIDLVVGNFILSAEKIPGPTPCLMLLENRSPQTTAVNESPR
jgi:hypothetical protein